MHGDSLRRASRCGEREEAVKARAKACAFFVSGAGFGLMSSLVSDSVAGSTPRLVRVRVMALQTGTARRPVIRP